MPQAVRRAGQTPGAPPPAATSPTFAPPVAPQSPTPAAPVAPAADPVGADLAGRMEQMMQQAAAPRAGGGAAVADPAAEAAILGALGATNWNDVQSNNFKLLPIETDIEFLIKKVTPTKAKTSGNPMIALELESTFPLEHAGVKVFDQVVLTETALWKAKSLFEACGMLGEDGRFTGASLQALVDFVIRGQVNHDTYQGVTRNKIAGGYTEAYETPGLSYSEAAEGGPVADGAPDWQQPE